MAWKSSFRQNYRTTFSPPQFPPPPRKRELWADVEAPGGDKWEHLKSGGKQWQAAPKNLPRMQRTRAIPVAWLNSGLCPDRPKGWIPIIIKWKVSFQTRRFFFLKAVAAVLLSCYGNTVTVLRTNLLSLNSDHLFTYPAPFCATLPKVSSVLPTGSVTEALASKKSRTDTNLQPLMWESIGKKLTCNCGSRHVYRENTTEENMKENISSFM